MLQPTTCFETIQIVVHSLVLLYQTAKLFFYKPCYSKGVYKLCYSKGVYKLCYSKGV